MICLSQTTGLAPSPQPNHIHLADIELYNDPFTACLFFTLSLLFSIDTFLNDNERANVFYQEMSEYTVRKLMIVCGATQ